MVPAIDGYNNTIKSENGASMPRSSPSPNPGLLGSVSAGPGLTVQLTLNGVSIPRCAPRGRSDPFLRIPCRGCLSLGGATSNPDVAHCPSTMCATLRMGRLQVYHTPLHAITALVINHTTASNSRPFQRSAPASAKTASFYR